MSQAVSTRKPFPIWRTLAALLLALLALLFLAHAVWVGKAKAQVTSRIAALKAAGEPVAPADFIETSIPDAQNLVMIIREAAPLLKDELDLRNQRNTLEVEDPYAFQPPLTDAEAALLRQLLADNAAALALLASADTRTGIAWGDYPGAVNISTVMSELTQVRSLANLLRDELRLAMHEKRYDDAVACALDIDALARSMKGRPGIVSTLVGIGIHAMASNAAMELAPHMEVGVAPLADRQNVQRLISTLLDDAKIVALVNNGLRTERVMIHDAVMAMINPPAAPAAPPPALPINSIARWNGLQRYAMRPILYHSDAAVLDMYTEGLKLTAQPSYADFKTSATALNAVTTAAQTGNTTVLAGILAPSINRYFEVSYRVRTERQLAATLLAIRLYAADHDGILPDSLDALVPTYLPAVPIDAMGGKPLRYDVKRGIVWSSGEDLVDNDGDDTQKRKQQSWNYWNAPDVVVHVQGKARPAPVGATTDQTTDEAGGSRRRSLRPRSGRRSRRRAASRRRLRRIGPCVSRR